jgi:N-terminal domain of anti-restriction factor ArdC
MTMKQVNELGGSVRKGEHSRIVVDQIANAETETGPDSDKADQKSRRRFVLRYFRVFNLEQCELPQAVLDKLPKIETHQHELIKAAERIIFVRVMARPAAANQAWPLDFVHDSLLSARRFRALAVIDEWSRERLAIELRLAHRRAGDQDVGPPGCRARPA